MASKSKIRQHYLFHEYYSRLKSIATTIFKWEGFPDSCNTRFLEDSLFHYGMAIFVNDDDYGYLTLKTTPSGQLNIYNEPVSYTAYGVGYNKMYDREDCVIIRNNPLQKSTESTIMIFAERLAEIESALQVNINAQKTPVLIRCDEKTRQSLIALYNQYEGNEPFIFGAKALMDKPLEAINTGAPFVADKLRAEKRAVWDEVMEFLGINTNPSDKKKERLIMAEVDSNNEQTDIQALTMLGTRQRACQEIKKKFGVDVKVSLRVEELKSLWDYGLHLRGEIPADAIDGIIKNQEEIEHGKLHD